MLFFEKSLCMNYNDQQKYQKLQQGANMIADLYHMKAEIEQISQQHPNGNIIMEGVNNFTADVVEKVTADCFFDQDNKYVQEKIIEKIKQESFIIDKKTVYCTVALGTALLYVKNNKYINEKIVSTGENLGKKLGANLGKKIKTCNII
jgi:hypothetical protein